MTASRERRSPAESLLNASHAGEIPTGAARVKGRKSGSLRRRLHVTQYRSAGVCYLYSVRKLGGTANVFVP
jgi:hypothetical protein